MYINCALHTVYRHTLYSSILLRACTLTIVLCTLYAVRCTVNTYVPTIGQCTPRARVVATVLHTLNTWALATLICTLSSNLPFEAKHFVSVLFLHLMKMTGIYFSFFFNIICHFCV